MNNHLTAILAFNYKSVELSLFIPESMASDATFLAEVEEFLVKCDLPTFPPLQVSNGCPSTNGSVASEVSTQGVMASEPIHTKASARRSKAKKDSNDLEATSKYEMLKAKDRQRRSVYRERRRIEKESLQQEVGELAAELAERQKAKELSLFSTWEMVAKRQLQARLNSEAEQRRLSTAIESRAALIQKLSGIVSCDLTVEDDTGLKNEVNYQHKRLRVKPSDAEFYEALLHELDTIYHQTDRILTTYALDSTNTTWNDPKRKWKEDGKNGYYIFLDKQVIPFGFQETGEKLWAICDLPHHQQDRQVYHGVDDPDNTLAFTFRNTTRLDSGRVVSVLQRVATRRYRQADRIVIVWRTFTEGEGIFTGMNADETGWGVITPSTTQSDTLMRTCMRHVPMHFTGSFKHKPAVREFTDLLLEAGTEEAVEITNSLEKLLLKEL